MGAAVHGRTLRCILDRFLYRLWRGIPFRKEADRVETSEWLLRRISLRSNWYDPNRTPPFARVSYQPNDKDVDGLSLFRESFISPTVLASTGGKPPYVIARVRVERFTDLGISIVASANQTEPPGHVSVPALAYESYLLDRPGSKSIQRHLAEDSSPAFNPTKRRLIERFKRILRI